MATAESGPTLLRDVVLHVASPPGAMYPPVVSPPEPRSCTWPVRREPRSCTWPVTEAVDPPVVIPPRAAVLHVASPPRAEDPPVVSLATAAALHVVSPLSRVAVDATTSAAKGRE